MTETKRPPQRGEAHDQLDFMEGRWSTREEYPPAPWMPGGGSGEGSATIRWMVGRLVLISEYRTEGSMGGLFEGHGLMTWAPDASAYVGYWFDNMMPTGIRGEGSFEDGKLTITYRRGEGEEAGEIRSVTTRISENEFTMVGSSRMDGAWVEAVRITYKRMPEEE